MLLDLRSLGEPTAVALAGACTATTATAGFLSVVAVPVQAGGGGEQWLPRRRVYLRGAAYAQTKAGGALRAEPTVYLVGRPAALHASASGALDAAEDSEVILLMVGSGLLDLETAAILLAA